MSIDYRQFCIVGKKFEIDDLYREISPDVFEEQPRYDTKTGKITHYEKVLVKSGEDKYTLFGEESDCPHDLSTLLGAKFNLACDYDAKEEVLYLGIDIFQYLEIDYGRVEMMEGSLSYEFLNKCKDELLELFPEDQIEIHFFTHVG